MEDELLIQELETLYSVSELSEGNSPTSVTHETHGTNRRWWSAAEDAAIANAIRKHGFRWRTIAKENNVGSEDSVRNRVLRWRLGQIPEDIFDIVVEFQNCRCTQRSPKQLGGVSHKAYTKEEDLAILDGMQNDLGTKHSWKRMQTGVLAHRTVHSIRNRAFRITSVVSRTRSGCAPSAADPGADDTRDCNLDAVNSQRQ